MGRYRRMAERVIAVLPEVERHAKADALEQFADTWVANQAADHVNRIVLKKALHDRAAVERGDGRG